jgi:hypothetical protein
LSFLRQIVHLKVAASVVRLSGAAHYPLRNTQLSSLSLVSEVFSWEYREGRLLKPAVKVSPLNFPVAEVAFQMYGPFTCHSCLGILA